MNIVCADQARDSTKFATQDPTMVSAQVIIKRGFQKKRPRERALQENQKPRKSEAASVASFFKVIVPISVDNMQFVLVELKHPRRNLF